MNRFFREIAPAVLALSSCFAGAGAVGQDASRVPHVNAPEGVIPQMPGDGAGAFATGQYRNLFAEEGKSPEEIRAKIDRAFQQLFHGDGPVGAGLLRDRGEREWAAGLCDGLGQQ